HGICIRHFRPPIQEPNDATSFCQPKFEIIQNFEVFLF
ncbi:MAG: hypothetical protein ACI92Z_002079, partial [Paracoccaceae bacterium]